MIVKRSRRNQVAIPKSLIQQAGLGDDNIFFNIEYMEGCFILKPLEFEEKISSETIERFKTAVLKKKTGDLTFTSMKELIAALDHKKRH